MEKLVYSVTAETLKYKYHDPQLELLFTACIRANSNGPNQQPDTALLFCNTWFCCMVSGEPRHYQLSIGIFGKQRQPTRSPTSRDFVETSLPYQGRLRAPTWPSFL
jgi:hypothetical protein